MFCVRGILLPAASPQTDHGRSRLILRGSRGAYRAVWRRPSQRL